MVLPKDFTSGIPGPAIEYNKKASDSKIGFIILRGSVFIATYALFDIACPKYTSPKAPSPNLFLTLYFLNII